MEELFLYSKDIHYLGKLIFDDISENEEDWIEYKKPYLNNKDILDSKIGGLIHEISLNGEKYKNMVAHLSLLLRKIDRKNILGFHRKKYKTCYDLYHLIENINWTLTEAYEHIKSIGEIQDNTERRCRELIVCRWVSDCYCINYDRGIHDEEIQEIKDVEVRLEFEMLINKLINHM